MYIYIYELFMSKSAGNRTNWYFGNPLYACLYTERKVGSASTIYICIYIYIFVDIFDLFS